jgi:mRNA-decapping enzyme subunit 2
MVPPAIQQPIPQHPPSAIITSPQFPGLHSPMVPPAPRQSPPKLTSHSLALLNAFKSRDQAIADANDLPLRRYTEEPTQGQHHLQELPADASLSPQQMPPPPPPEARTDHRLNQVHGQNPTIFSIKKQISETHKTTLLDLFKSPVAANAVPVAPVSSTALPPSSTPSAVELSAVEPLSTNAVSTSALLNNKRTPDHINRHSPMPEVNPEANLPFRAMTILSRPSELSEKEAPIRNGSIQKKRPSAKKPNASQGQRKQSPEKPFQPQILKRPPPGPLMKASPTPTPAQPSFKPLSEPLPDGHIGQAPSKQIDHRATLLSMFGKNDPSTPVIPLPLADPTMNISARSRVGSLVSGDPTSRRGSHTPISPADKGFLLNYLDAVAKGQR